MRTQAVLFFVPALFLLAGCPIYGGSGDPPMRCVGSECECSLDRDCNPGWICQFEEPSDSVGMCVPGRLDAGTDGGIDMTPGDVGPGDVGPTMCRTHGDCSVGDYCNDANVCTGSGTCTNDTTCENGFHCDFRDTCVPDVENACRNQNDCSGATLCIEGFCRDTADLCQFGYDCRAGQACVNGACTNICAGPSDCGSGLDCMAGFCRPVTECSNSAQCDGGEHCVQGRCLPDCQSSTTCGLSADYCAEDAFCRPDWQQRPFCTLDTECTAGSVCRDGACRTPCPLGTDAECRSTDASLSCGAMNLCVSTQTPECSLDAQCSDQECVNAICR